MLNPSENPKKPDDAVPANPAKAEADRKPADKPVGKPAGKLAGKFAGKQWLSMGQLASSGAELGLTVAVLTLIGYWLDTKWNSSPWMLLTGALIGTLGSMYKLWRLNAKMTAKYFGKDKKGTSE